MAASSGQQLGPDTVGARWNIASSASQKANCPDISISATPQEIPGQDTRPPLKVTLLGSEWNSSAGGLSTLNRELAIHLSKHPKVEVSLLVPEGACKDVEKREAQSLGITVVDAKERPGYEPLDWLSFPPEHLSMNIVVGHGVKLGRQGQVIKDLSQFPNCKWVQVVHTAPEDLSRYKTYPYPISKGERKHQVEVDVCKLADLVVPIGPRLKEAYSSYLRRCKKDQDVFPITPGLFDREFGDLEQAPNENVDFNVLIFGRGDDEDFELKGYNIAAEAFTDHRLKQKPYHLIFVGTPEGKQGEVRKKLLQCGIADEQLTVRKFIQSRDRMKDLLCEADLVIMPSKSEGFGLVALEALSAGLPILVGSKSGFAEALEKVPIGHSCIVGSDDPTKWAEAIEAVRVRRRMRLQEIKALRASYDMIYSWKEQCESLVERMWRMVHGEEFKASIPSYVVARGPEAIAAYQKAKESGTILDRRVKVLLIGQDRVGKTSVGRSLKGEKFRNNETSTDGVQMHEPFQNPGKQPWKNFTMEQETTAYHHKCAEYIGRELHAGPTVEQAPQQELETERPGSISSNSTLDENQKSSISGLSDDLRPDTLQTELPVGVSRRLAPDENQASFESTIQADSDIPDKIAHLIPEKVDEMESDTSDGIWPVIWDFAGQAVYRAIHPIFMSPEAVYVLVCDLTKNLFTTAPCKVKEDGREEVEIPAPDTGDTNLDHILRWMDLVHSFRHSESEYKLPPVVLVGTHADEVGYPEKKIDCLKNFLMYNTPDFLKRIAKTLTINNTLAGRLSIDGEEDPQIVRLRQEILTVAETMPHTKKEVPLKWLEVENKVCDHVKEKNEKYMSKQKFKVEIFDKICQPEREDVLEHILNFLHDRGTVVHHDRPENPDGLIVLDPQWLISDVLCKIITAKQQKEDELDILLLRKDLEDKGILHDALLHHACRNLELVHIKESLIYIMKKFNLLFECKGKNEKTVYLVPCMLTNKPAEDMMSHVFQGCKPVFITFSTNYVPVGLFTRLLVIFGEWASSRTNCEQPQLFANAARFFIGKVTCLDMSCCKTVIKIHIWTMDNSNPVEREPGLSSEVSRILQNALQRLRVECRWLHVVSWKLCGQCKLCPGKVDPKTRKCFRHQKRECFHDDCAHYVSVHSSPFCCKDGKGPDLRIPQTWIQALSWDLTLQEQSCNKGKRTVGSGLEELSHDPRPIKEGTPSDDELEDLSQRVAEAWKPLGRRLNIDEAKLTAFHKENEEYSEKAYKMLLHWKERDSTAATYQVLYNALRHKLVQKQLLAEELCCD